MKKEELAKEIYERQKDFYAFLGMLKRDNIFERLFPDLREDLIDELNIIPNVDIRENYHNKKFVKKLHDSFKKYDKHLLKDVRAEKHDHHGLHIKLKKLIEKTAELLDQL